METSAANAPEPVNVAAVDLGSNSFHMVIARFVEHDLHIIDRLREPVRLAGGLGEGRKLSAEARERAIGCLERFGQRLAGIPSGRVRAVGTNTLRRAQDSLEFRTLARRALGHEIEVLSGHEEARLIYLGVAHTHSYDEQNRLVVDIGGGSTEVILGRGFDPVMAASRGMGCVSYTRRFFPGGGLTKERFREAALAASLELRADKKALRKATWRAAVGASGTINAVASVLELNSLSDGPITYDGIRELRKALVSLGSSDKIDLPGVKPDRAPVFAGGVAILAGVFRSLKIDSMTVSPGALREGVLYDLVGRIRHRDVRDRTIRRMIGQYQVDHAQAHHVRQAALDLLGQVCGKWELNDVTAGRLLSWAAHLHEIGLVISHSEYNRHGEYLIRNSDLPGFSRNEQRMLATLVRGHRKKIRPYIFDEISPERKEEALRLCVIFRLAVLLYRSRRRRDTPPMTLQAGKKSLKVSFPEGWLEGKPLTRADLEREAAYLKAVGFKLVTPK